MNIIYKIINIITIISLSMLNPGNLKLFDNALGKLSGTGEISCLVVILPIIWCIAIISLIVLIIMNKKFKSSNKIFTTANHLSGILTIIAFILIEVTSLLYGLNVLNIWFYVGSIVILTVIATWNVLQKKLIDKNGK